VNSPRQASLIWLRYYWPPNGTVLYFYQVRTSCKFWIQVVFFRIIKTGNVRYQHGIEAHSYNHFCSVKERITYSESVCSLRFPTCPALQYFSTLSHKLHGYRGKKLLHIKCVFCFPPIIFVWNIILRRHDRDVIKNFCWSSWKYPLFLSEFKETWIFSTDFRKVLRYQISSKFFHWEPSCSLRAGGRTDRRAAGRPAGLTWRS
jgi:hypothetical protein